MCSILRSSAAEGPRHHASPPGLLAFARCAVCSTLPLVRVLSVLALQLLQCTSEYVLLTKSNGNGHLEVQAELRLVCEKLFVVLYLLSG